jgi:RNA polymerase sigma-70 factor (ECF subfamily)
MAAGAPRAAREGNEAGLLAAARDGDPEALESLLGRYQGSVLRFSRRMCRDAEDARDVLQDTLLAMARGIRAFRGASSLSTWLYTIARSHCIKQRRRSKFAGPEVSLDGQGRETAAALPDPGRGPEQMAAERELSQRLDEALARLEPEQREVLLLRDVEGLTAAETAEVVGISVAAVKSRLHRARASLRARLRPVLEPAHSAPAGCPDIVALFSRHLEGEIDAGLCAEMERHLAACPRCASACESLKETLRACRALPPADVPADLQESIRRAVRNALAGRD